MGELHTGAGQLQHVAVAQLDGFVANRGAVHQRHAVAFYMRQHKTVGPFGDGRHGNPWFANGGDHFDQGHLAPDRRAGQNPDRRIGHGCMGRYSTGSRRSMRCRGDRRGLALPHHTANTAAGLENRGLVEPIRVALGRELELVFADFDGVAAAQLLSFDCFAVDIGAIGAVQVFNEHIHAQHAEDSVLSADGQVVDHDVVVGSPAQRGALLGQLHVFDDNTVNRHNHFCHERLLLP